MADLQIEYGKTFLLKEEFANAHKAFAMANKHRHSLKLTGITWLARLAPRLLLNHYRSRRADGIEFVPTQTTTQGLFKT